MCETFQKMAPSKVDSLQVARMEGREDREQGPLQVTLYHLEGIEIRVKIW